MPSATSAPSSTTRVMVSVSTCAPNATIRAFGAWQRDRGHERTEAGKVDDDDIGVAASPRVTGEGDVVDRAADPGSVHEVGHEGHDVHVG